MLLYKYSKKEKEGVKNYEYYIGKTIEKSI